MSSSIAKKLADKANTKTEPHIIVEALAGTGKTTTLIEGLKALRGLDTSIKPSVQQKAVWEQMMAGPEPASVNFVAFNKLIAKELSRRVPTGCDAMTMHGMGNRIVRQSFNLRNGGVNGFRVGDITERISLESNGKNKWDLKRYEADFFQGVDKLVGLCKVNLTEPTAKNLDKLVSHYDVHLNGSKSKTYDYVPQVLERCKDVDEDGEMDYNDMIWLPVVLDLPCMKYDFLIWDEAQDGNRCQQALAKKCGRRLMLCGDRHQAIYGFAGADHESMTRMEQELSETDSGVVVLPLTTTYRCGSAIVKEAQKIVSGLEAHESTGTGIVSEDVFDVDSEKRYLSRAENGDMILCRCNAPLISECFKLLKRGVKANIQGRDVGQGLVATIKRLFKNEAKKANISNAKKWTEFFKTLRVIDMVQKLAEMTHNEVEKEMKKRGTSELKIANLQDKEMCLNFFSEGCDQVSEVVDSIEEIFTDKTTTGILLSSIHKAKGLEADRVFLIEPGSATVPHPMAKQDWEMEQEWNLRYVAITRAKKEIVYVA